MENKMQRTAITGIGMMCALGLDLETSWQGLLEGQNPIRRFSLFDPCGLNTTFGGELPEGADDVFASCIKRRWLQQMTRGTKMAVVIADMALRDADLNTIRVDPGRVGVVLGATGSGYVPPEQGVDQHRILRNMTSAPAAWVSLKGKFQGPSMVVGTACSSGVYALAVAHAWITSGLCDVVISGSADSSLNYADVQGFCSLMALADDDDMPCASRPFDRNRNGFVLSEGGGILIVESMDHALKRNARIYAEMSEPGLYSEAYNILAPQPNGEGIVNCMRIALDKAGISPENIDYINAHGTSTFLNDLDETLAIKKVFGNACRSVAVSSTKSMTGHCLSGAAGLEAVICCKAMHESIIPPTINLKDPDPELDLDFVPHRARQKNLVNVMSNSFAFGGHNGIVVFSKQSLASSNWNA